MYQIDDSRCANTKNSNRPILKFGVVLKKIYVDALSRLRFELRLAPSCVPRGFKELLQFSLNSIDLSMLHERRRRLPRLRGFVFRHPARPRDGKSMTFLEMSPDLQSTVEPLSPCSDSGRLGSFFSLPSSSSSSSPSSPPRSTASSLIFFHLPHERPQLRLAAQVSLWFRLGFLFHCSMDS